METLARTDIWYQDGSAFYMPLYSVDENDVVVLLVDPSVGPYITARANAIHIIREIEAGRIVRATTAPRFYPERQTGLIVDRKQFLR